MLAASWMTTRPPTLWWRRLRSLVGVRLVLHVAATIEQPAQAPRRDREPACRLAAIAAAQFHRGARRGRRDLVECGGKGNRRVTRRPSSRIRRGEQLVDVELTGRREQQRALHRVLELPDVPRPGMPAQPLAHLW